jgi:phenol 2-monooxygenase
VEQVFLDHLDDKDVQVERHKVAEQLHLSSADVDEEEQFPVVVGVRCAGTYGMYLSRGFLSVRKVTLELG